MELKKYIAEVQDYPIQGVNFKDITSLIEDPKAFSYALDQMQKLAEKFDVDLIAGPDARGFIFGCPLADRMGKGFIPFRKPGKLPRKTIDKSYELEYGTNTLSVTAGSINPGDKVLIVDDLIATGGTVNSMCEMIEEMGGTVAGIIFLINLSFLSGVSKLSKYNVIWVVEYK